MSSEDDRNERPPAVHVMSSPAASSSESVRVVRVNTKRTKNYVETKGAALDLASVIAGKVEDKTNAKVEKNRQMTHVQASERPQTNPRTTSKAKLREVKTSIKAKMARAKKERSKARNRSAVKDDHTSRRDRSSVAGPKATQSARKRVTFA